jgi:Flp pilus assembly protein TadG
MKWKSEEGAIAVEMAILLPILVLLLFGSIEFGALLYNKHVITNASREGARAGIVAQSPKPTSSEITAIAQDFVQNNIIYFGSPGATSVTVTNAGAAFPADLTVTVSYAYNFLVLRNLGFGPVNLQSTTVMRME